MAERVIDLLEAVEVDQEDRAEYSLALRLAQRLLYAVIEQDAIGQVRQGIVEGLVSVLGRLPPKPPGGRGDDAIEHRVEHGEATEEDQIELCRVTSDRCGDRAIREIELERPVRHRTAVELERHIDLEELPIAMLPNVLQLVRVR